MPAKSNQTHYGTVIVLLHWATALLIIALLATGFRAGGTEDAGQKAAILSLHIPIAVAVLALTIFRVLWWLFADRKPESVPMPRWQDISARAVHVLFYVVIFGMAASGIVMMVLSGAGPAIFGGADAVSLPDFRNFLPRVPHGLGGRLMLALIVLHAGAALYHQFIKHDGLLRRMWFR